MLQDIWGSYNFVKFSQHGHYFATMLLHRHFLTLPQHCQLMLGILSFLTNWQLRYKKSSDVATTLWQRFCVCYVAAASSFLPWKQISVVILKPSPLRCLLSLCLLSSSLSNSTFNSFKIGSVSMQSCECSIWTDDWNSESFCVRVFNFLYHIFVFYWFVP